MKIKGLLSLVVFGLCMLTVNADAACDKSYRIASFDVLRDTTTQVVKSSSSFIWSPAQDADGSTCSDSELRAMVEDDNYLPNLRQQNLIDAGRIPATALSFNSSEIHTVQVSSITGQWTLEAVSIGGGLANSCLAKLQGCVLGKSEIDIATDSKFSTVGRCRAQFDEFDSNGNHCTRGQWDNRCNGWLLMRDSNGVGPGWCD